MSPIEKLFKHAPEGATNINWSKAPEGTTEIVMIDETKAIRWAKKSHVWSFAYRKWRPRGEDWVTIAIREPEPHFKATRENLEKIAKDAKGDFVEFGEQESEPEWTHTYGEDNCYIKVSEPDRDGYIVICTEEDGYMLAQPMELESIKHKPKITKAEAWDLCQDYGGKLSIREYMHELNEKYEVVE